MQALRSLGLWIVACVIPYVMLTLLIHEGVDTPIGQSALANLAGFLWLAGPPILLLVDPASSWPVYLLGTSVFLLSAFLTIHFGERGPELSLVFAATTAAIWFGFGVLICLAMV